MVREVHMQSMMPDILQLRRTLQRRRQSPEQLLLMGFAGLLLTLTVFGTYAAVRQYVAGGWPIYPLLLATISFWVTAGLPSQTHLHADQQWSLFARQMPVGPAHLLAVHAWSGLLPNLVIGLCVTCGLAGASTVLGYVSWIHVLLVILGAAWALCMQVTVGMLGWRLRRARPWLVVVLSAWVLLLIVRSLWGLATDPSHVWSIVDQDPILWLVGIVPLAQALLAPTSQAAHVGGAILHLVLLIGTGVIISWRLAALPPMQHPGASLAVRLTSWLRPALGQRIAGPRGAQICIEWLRTFRSASSLMFGYALAGFVGSLILRVRYAQEPGTVLVLALLAFCMVSDGSPQLLRLRRANRLYDLCGTDSRDFLYGFITSVGVAVTAICLAQVPVFLRPNLPRWIIPATCAASAGIAFGMVDVAVIIERRLRVAGFFGRILASCILIVFAYVLFMLGMGLPIAPLLLAVGYTVATVRQASRLRVKRQYWKMDDGTTGQY